MGQPFVGSPETVLTQITDVRDQIGMGRIELAVMGAPRHEDVMRAIALVGETIVPALHADDLVASASGPIGETKEK
jgi:hypothetical protein